LQKATIFKDDIILLLSMESRSNAKEVVMSFVKALNNEDFKTAKSYVSDNMSFLGPLASLDNAEAYFKDMERIRLKFDIKKVFVDGDDVCLLYDFSVGTMTLFGCGWYHVEQGKISSLRVVFDPRPLVESSVKR
jgi:limonene-1,2-epoxide hydrolase